MFENFKGMASMAGVLKDLPRIRDKMEEVKQRLGQQTVVAETGGGAVRATANGLLRIVSIEVEPPLMTTLVDATSAEDRALAQDLIAGAVNAALEKARHLAEDAFSSAAGELGLPIPPGGLGGLLGS